MQIFEVKDDTAKIEYNSAENNLTPTDFVLIEEGEQKIIAQIQNICTTDNPNSNIAEVKFSLSIDEEENLTYYNGLVPTKDSLVIYIKPEEIISLIKDEENNIYFGNLSNHKDCFVNTSISTLNDKMYIQSDRDDKTKIIIQNIISELYGKKKKILMLDFDGRYNSILNVERLKVGNNLRLPLNIEAFDAILENDTKDCDEDDIAVINNIVDELREYISTLDEKFLPFSTFKTVIDSELDNNSLSGLIQLSNKLENYSQENIFAENFNEFNLINENLIRQNIIIVDVSELDEKWHKYIIKTIINIAENETYLILALNDNLADNNLINYIYNANNIIPIISTNYEFKYREDIKNQCKNQILFKPAKELTDKEVYNNFINKLNASEFILWGNSTFFIPLIIDIQPFDASTSQEIIENEIKQDVDNLLFSQGKAISVENVNTEETKPPIPADNETDDFNDEDLDFLDSEQNNISTSEEKKEEYDIFHPIINEENYTDETNIKPMGVTDYNNNEIIEEDNLSDTLNENSDIEDIIGLSEPEALIESKEDEDDPTSSKLDDILSFEEDTEKSSVLDEIADINESQTQKETSVLDDIADINTSQTQNETSILDDIAEINTSQIKNETSILDDIADINTSQIENETSVLDDIADINTSQIENETSILDDTKTEKETNNISVLDKIEKEIINNQQNKDANENSNKGNLTVYKTDEEHSDINNINNIPFKIGDKVYHPKHGNGVIEGFANYSNKILFCQVEFENVGRRILDPRISGLEKIS